MERDSWGLHPDCVEDCCWAARLERAGGPVEVTAEGAETLRTFGLLGDDETLALNFERLETVSHLSLEGLRVAMDKLIEWEGLNARDRLSNDEYRSAVWVPFADAAVAAWDAGLRTEVEFRSWFGEDVIPVSFRTQLIRELLSRGVRPQTVWESMRGSDAPGDWRKMNASEFRRMVARDGLEWPEDPGAARRRALALAEVAA